MSLRDVGHAASCTPLKQKTLEWATRPPANEMVRAIGNLRV